MSESETTEESTETPVHVERPSGWFVFNEKPVMLQLREPYIGVTYAYAPSKDKDGEGVRATPVLSGILHVEPDGNGGVMLAIQMPTGNGNDYALVALAPKDVLYATHIHTTRIIA